MSYFVHGHSIGNGSPTYKSWAQMLQRCQNEGDPSYARYGGRGISVCDRWQKFENFIDDMGERPIGTSLDRKDHFGRYEPANCRWATRLQQQNNTRSNVRVAHEGKEMTLAEWARDCGISYVALKQRWRSGERPPRLFRQLEARFSHKRSKVLA